MTKPRKTITLQPGKAYRYSDVLMEKPWCVARTRDTFLENKDGLCAFFNTQEEAAYAGRIK